MCDEEFLEGAAECIWAGTEYTSYAAFRNIAGNYSTGVAETDWATMDSFDVIYTNIQLSADSAEIVTSNLVAEAVNAYTAAVGFPAE